MGALLWDYIYSSWVDLCSVLIALAYGKLQCNRIPGRAFISRDTGLTIIHGLVVFPLGLLFFASFFPPALEALLHSHRIILAGAAVVALFSLFEKTSV